MAAATIAEAEDLVVVAIEVEDLVVAVAGREAEVGVVEEVVEAEVEVDTTVEVAATILPPKPNCALAKIGPRQVLVQIPTVILLTL